ncbi:MAG: Y4bD/Y4pK family protein [Actinobacteria bacterium]|nr:Y4bD/Y4pK family protein [Actinomycetota bacterium]MCA1699620.1 Y4bD/Y4pK family protein [Actinomycetota bacterium]
MTHPFHPWVGREFVFVAARQTWGEDRVFLLDDDGVQRSLPRGFTDAADADPFVAVAAGRSALRVADLLELVELLDGVRRPASAAEV